jgi:hypothetical protein
MIQSMKPLALALLLSSSLASAPPLTVRDLDGKSWTPLNPPSAEINALVFVGADCPISNRYAPEIDRIAREYQPRHVRTFLVYADLAADRATAAANVRAFHPGLSAPVVIDTGFQLTAALGVTVTPEAVVVTAAGRRYRGRIDDLYVNAGQARRVASQHDLRDALEALLNGKPVPQPETRAVGCFIERTPS